MSATLALILCAVASRPSEIELWTRAPGLHREALDHLDSRIADLDLLELETVKLYDIQLRAERTYRGLRLSALLERYPGPPAADAVILHTKNGVRVVLPLEPAKRVRAVFIARSYLTPGGELSTSFPDLARRRGVQDPRPLVFMGNKLVVSELNNPLEPERDGFSPFLHTDSLTGIEFIRQAEHFAETAAEPEVERGHRVFLRRCAACHAAHGVGGQLGWDFVVPIPLYEYRDSKSLYEHVRYENGEALAKGFLMPAQKDVEPEEVRELWGWMRAIVKQGPRPYP